MNRKERKVLQDHHMELIDGIYVTADLMGNFYQAGLFDSVMIDEIRNEPENVSKVTKMLELVKTRGPEAFTKFVQILEIKHDWLAKALMTSLDKLDKETKSDINSMSSLSKKNVTHQQSQNCSTQDDKDDTIAKETYETELLNHKTPDNTSSNLCSECQKNICSQCLVMLKSIDKDTVPQKQTKSVRFHIDGKITDNFNRTAIRKLLLDLCIKLKVHSNASTNHQKHDDMSYTDDTKTFEFLEDQIDGLLNRIKSIEEERSQCFQILGEKGKKKTLVQLVDNLSAKCLRLQKQLMEKGKVEEICKHLKMAQSDLQEQYYYLQEKYKNLKIKNEELNKCHTNRESYQVEKQKTLKDMHDLYDKMKKTLEKTNNEEKKSNLENNHEIGESGVKIVNRSHGKISEVSTETTIGEFTNGVDLTAMEGHSLDPKLNGKTSESQTITEKEPEEIQIKRSQGEITKLKKLQEARDRQKALLEKTGFIKFADKMPLNEAKSQFKGNNSHVKNKTTVVEKPNKKTFQTVSEKPTNLRTTKKNPFYQSRISNLF